MRNWTEGIAASVATVPEEYRKLLTYHDSWAYFAGRYGLEVVGAVQPSGFSEPSTRAVARLIDQVRSLGLPAVFGSEVFPSDVLEQIAKESGAAYVDDLRDDDLPGAPGDPRHSYFGLMLENMETMITALGGSAAALADFDPGPVFQGASNAVLSSVVQGEELKTMLHPVPHRRGQEAPLVELRGRHLRL